MSRTPTGNRKLSFYLAKEEFADFDSVIKGNPASHDVKVNNDVIGKLFIKNIPGKVPPWFSFFEPGVPSDIQRNLRNQSASAAFLLSTRGRIFALTFGYGRSLLDPACIEDRFGLKVALNTIDRDKMRIIDRKNLDTLLTQTRTQTSRRCAIEDFHIDTYQVLLKAVTGEAKDDSFAKCVSGSDSTCLNCNATLDTIVEKCGDLLDAFNREDYKQDFPWVDNIKEIRNKNTIDSLNDELVSRLQASSRDKLFLAIPDIVEWGSIQGFKFMKRQGEVFPDIRLTDFLGSVGDFSRISATFLKNRRVLLVHTDSDFIEAKWPVYQCINYETSRDNQTFLLTGGTWYQVDSSYMETVNNQMSAISKVAFPFIATQGQSEEDFNKSVHDSDPNFALMDRKNINYGGGKSKIEFCDLYHRDKMMVHVKKYSGSSVLSHLFAQGVNSARVFLEDTNFRQSVGSKLPSSHRFDPALRPEPKDFHVMFGIISAHPEGIPDNLPFFSKITLAQSKKELELLGFKISVAGIEMTGAEAGSDE